MAVLVVRILLCVPILHISLSAPPGDEVTSLPGLTVQLPWKHFSGYLNGMDQHKLHYWFIQSSSTQPENDPVVLWLNGGPGCSSMVGLLLEHGPFLLQQDVSLKMNQYSWNKVANMLYLEAPVGVGYSYAKDNAENITYNDETTAIDNLLALQDFFVKFPELKSNPLFIAGESYGGFYVPTLSELVVDYPEFNFQGFAVGNALLDWKWFTEAMMYFFYHHGIIGEKEWKMLLDGCCRGGNPLRCKLKTSLECRSKLNEIDDNITAARINFYSVYSTCEGYNGDTRTEKVMSNAIGEGKLTSMAAKIFAAENGYPCVDTTFLDKYMNQEEVRTSLHIPQALGKWTTCSSSITYQRFTNNNMTKQFIAVLKNLKRIMVYNGDTDPVIPYNANQWFLDDLNLTETKPYTPWTVKDNTGKSQNGGFYRSYKNLDFVTIKGAGHKAARGRPAEALKVFKYFINNKQLD